MHWHIHELSNATGEKSAGMKLILLSHDWFAAFRSFPQNLFTRLRIYNIWKNLNYSILCTYIIPMSDLLLYFSYIILKYLNMYVHFPYILLECVKSEICAY